MRSRFNALSDWPLEHPLLASSSLHGLLGLAALATFITPNWKSTNVDLEVIEMTRAPTPAVQLAKPQPEKKEAPKPRAVFGVSRKALTDESSNVTSKAGNTVAKAQDRETLRPEDADALPVPTEEYLVSQMPTLAAEVRIPYPPEAKRKGAEGPVVMDLLIDSSGRVRQATLVSGPEESLNQAALEAVKGFVFRPARLQDQPVAVKIRYAYRFVLER